MSITIYSIIVHLNERKTLLPCLNALLNQTIPKDLYKILLVDGASKEYVFNDELKKIFFNQNIKYLFKKGANAAELFNLGVAAAKGEIIFFTESDYAAPGNWLEEFIKNYERYPDIIGVGGWHEIASFGAGFLQKCADAMDNKFGGGILDAEIKTNLYFFPYIGAEPANLSYKKSILEECGGFDENLHSNRQMAKEFNIKVLAREYPFLHLPLKVKKTNKLGLKYFFYQYLAEGRDLFYLHNKYPRLIADTHRNFLRNVLGQISHAEVNYFYTAYFFSALFRIGGRVIAKYWERPVIKEINLLPNENFEISKHLAGEKKYTQTSGRPFDKSVFLIEESGDFYSIIIPTYNRSRGLINALNHLIEQTIPANNYEIIIVDDGSTDDTESQVAKYKILNTKYNIRYFKIPNGGPAKARNFGIKQSKGEIIFFTDDDCVVPPNWMETLLSGLKRYPEAVGAGGWIWPPKGEMEKSAVSRFLHFESFYGHPIIGGYIRSHEVLSNNPLMCFGNFAYNTANICYKKEVLKTVGGFKEDFYWPGSEDNELAFRITNAGYQLLYLPFHIIHPKDMSLSKFAKLHFRRGANGYLLRTMHRELLEKIKPGFVNDYGSVASFISRLSGPEKFLALLEWLSLNVGVRYMKNRLTKSDNPGSESSANR